MEPVDELLVRTEVYSDLEGLQPHERERILERIEDWKRQLTWGRNPRKKLVRLENPPFDVPLYREVVGKSKFRIFYVIRDGEMICVGVSSRRNVYDRDVERLARRGHEALSDEEW